MEKIEARFILEALGRPEEKVNEAMKIVEEKLKEDKNFKVVDLEVEKATFDKERNVFTALIELDVKFDDIKKVFDFMYTYMPTSIEITHPEKIITQMNVINNLLNETANMFINLSQSNRFLIAENQELKEKLGKK